jgi:hypothetical protein
MLVYMLTNDSMIALLCTVHVYYVSISLSLYLPLSSPYQDASAAQTLGFDCDTIGEWSQSLNQFCIPVNEQGEALLGPKLLKENSLSLSYFQSWPQQFTPQLDQVRMRSPCNNSVS